MNRNINIATAASIAVMLIILAAIALSGLDRLKMLAEANRAAKHSNDIIVSLHQILETIQNAETGQRGYLITGREDYLAPYTGAETKAKEIIGQLNNLTANDPSFSQSIAKLKNIVSFKFAELRKTIDLRRTQGFAAANAVVSDDIGQRAMDNIRLLVKQMTDKESQSLMDRNREQDKREKDTLLTLLLISFVAVLFQIATGLAIIKFISKKQLAEDALKDREQKLRLLLSGIKDYAIFMLDPQGNIMTWNEGAEQIMGYSTNEIIGKNFSMFQIDKEKAQDKSIEELKIAAESGIYESEGQRLRKNGSQFWANIIIRPLLDQSGQITGFVKVTHDITERKEVERRMNEFNSMVSHELRTPLTSIRGTLSLLEGGRLGPLSERAGHLIHMARLESDRLVRLINDILDIRKIQAGKFELKFQEANPSDIIESVLGVIENIAAAASVQLISEIKTTEKIYCDFDRITQVMTNLISNAIKFSPANSQILVQVKDTKTGEVHFSVTDQGSGIPVEQMPKLFKTFQQLDSSDNRAKGGTGLGLAISKAIIEQHGGRIAVESTVGKGSTFWFELPCKTSLPTSKLNFDKTSHHKILLVEDDRAMCDLLGEMLSHHGFAVDNFSSLAEAEQYLSLHPNPDVILLDVLLPDGNGLDLLDKLRQSDKTDHTPVVVITGRDESLGTYGHPLLIDWIKKPFDEQRLLSALKLAIRSRQPGRARVLVVDDDQPTRELIKEELQQFNIEYFEATDGVEAIHLARTIVPDLIILDLAMPTPNGFDVVQILRNEKLKSTPLLVYTARDLNEIDKEKLTLGLTAHLTKSRTSETEFLDTVRTLLNGLVTQPMADKVN